MSESALTPPSSNQPSSKQPFEQPHTGQGISLFGLLWRQSVGAGGLGVLLAALILAVTATTTLQFATQTVRDAIGQQAGQLLAADMVLSSSDPIRPVWADRAQGLQQTSVILFSSMAQGNGQFALVNVKAVTEGYPLRGALTLSPDLLPKSQPPQSGTVWLEPRLAILLGVQVGQSIQIGDARLVVAGEIERDPNRETGFSGFSPTVLINQADVPATNAIQVGSRIDYRLLLAGTPTQVRQFTEQWQDNTDPDEKLRLASEGNSRLLKPVNLLNDYAQIASVLTLLLCGIAVALAMQRLSARQYDSLALLRCLGASQRQLALHYAQLLLGLWLIAVVVGAVLGLLGGWGLLTILQAALPAVMLPFEPLRLLGGPLLTAALTAGLMLLGFALPSVLRLLRVSPLKVLRAEQVPVSWSAIWIVAIAWGVLLLFLLLQTGRMGLSLVMLLGLSTVLLLLFGFVYGCLRLLATRQIALDGLARQPLASSLRIVALGLGGGLIGVVLLLRGDLLQRWQSSLPVDAPNQFVYGLPSYDKANFEQAVAQYVSNDGWSVSPLYPMVKGRLLTLNSQPLQGEAAKDRSTQRELNLSMSATFPADNVLVAGQTFTGPNQVSVEAEVAERLGIKVGDQLTMSLPEGPLTAKVQSLRQVEWDRFTPNFFFIYSPETLDPNAGSYLGSMYVPPSDQVQLATLIRAFPTTLLIDVGAVLSEVRRLLQLLGQGLGLLAGLVSIAGVLVLLASLRMMVDERQPEVALLRTLGLSRRQLQQRLLGEMAILGAVSGVVAVALAEGLSLVLAWRMDLPIQLHLMWWVLGPVLMMLLAIAMGALPLRQLWRQSALAVLRQQ